MFIDVSALADYTTIAMAALVVIPWIVRKIVSYILEVKEELKNKT